MADVFDMIVAGDIPAYKIYEDDDVLAFLDLSQTTPGHTLVIPKQHVTDIFAYDEALASRVLSKLPRIARAIKASDERIVGLNILSNNGEAAGQSVFHSHFHLIPRYVDDNFDVVMADNTATTTQADYEKMAARIKQQMENS